MDNEKKLYIGENHEITSRPKEVNSLQNQMVAMGKALMRAKKNMSLDERKLLIIALTKIKWTTTDNVFEVIISKLEIKEVLGWKCESSQLSRNVRKLADSLAKHSFIEMEGADKEKWDNGFLIPRHKGSRGNIHIFFAEQFRPLLENLTKDKDFVTIWANDIYNFKSLYAYLLFEDLRLHSDTTRTNWRTYSTKELKNLFGIPKDGKGSYMHKNKDGKEVFDRSNFEKYVLDVAIEEINNGQMVRILPFEGMIATPKNKNKIYAKIKKNGFIVGYQFKYDIYASTVPFVKNDNMDDDNLPGQYKLEMDGTIVEEV